MPATSYQSEFPEISGRLCRETRDGRSVQRLFKAQELIIGMESSWSVNKVHPSCLVPFARDHVTVGNAPYKMAPTCYRSILGRRGKSTIAPDQWLFVRTEGWTVPSKPIGAPGFLILYMGGSSFFGGTLCWLVKARTQQESRSHFAGPSGGKNKHGFG